MSQTPINQQYISIKTSTVLSDGIVNTAQEKSIEILHVSPSSEIITKYDSPNNPYPSQASKPKTSGKLTRTNRNVSNTTSPQYSRNLSKTDAQSARPKRRYRRSGFFRRDPTTKQFIHPPRIRHLVSRHPGFDLTSAIPLETAISSTTDPAASTSNPAQLSSCGPPRPGPPRTESQKKPSLEDSLSIPSTDTHTLRETPATCRPQMHPKTFTQAQPHTLDTSGTSHLHTESTEFGHTSPHIPTSTTISQGTIRDIHAPMPPTPCMPPEPTHPPQQTHPQSQTHPPQPFHHDPQTQFNSVTQIDTPHMALMAHPDPEKRLTALVNSASPPPHNDPTPPNTDTNPFNPPADPAYSGSQKRRKSQSQYRAKSVTSPSIQTSEATENSPNISPPPQPHTQNTKHRRGGTRRGVGDSLKTKTKPTTPPKSATTNLPTKPTRPPPPTPPSRTLRTQQRRQNNKTLGTTGTDTGGAGGSPSQTHSLAPPPTSIPKQHSSVMMSPNDNHSGDTPQPPTQSKLRYFGSHITHTHTHTHTHTSFNTPPALLHIPLLAPQASIPFFPNPPHATPTPLPTSPTLPAANSTFSFSTSPAHPMSLGTPTLPPPGPLPPLPDSPTSPRTISHSEDAPHAMPHTAHYPLLSPSLPHLSHSSPVTSHPQHITSPDNFSFIRTRLSHRMLMSYSLLQDTVNSPTQGPSLINTVSPYNTHTAAPLCSPDPLASSRDPHSGGPDFHSNHNILTYSRSPNIPPPPQVGPRSPCTVGGFGAQGHDAFAPPSPCPSPRPHSNHESTSSPRNTQTAPTPSSPFPIYGLAGAPDSSENDIFLLSSRLGLVSCSPTQSPITISTTLGNQSPLASRDPVVQLDSVGYPPPNNNNRSGK